MIIKAKNNTWFKYGTIVECIDDYRPDIDAGLFRGLRVCDSKSEDREIGEEYIDEEMCEWSEFEITEKKRDE